MRKWLPRLSKEHGLAVEFGEPPIDVFEQPDRSLLGEALSRPLGLCAALGLTVAIGIFAANHFMFGWEKIDDYALVGFFVAGGILLSIVLRSGDPNASPRKRARRSRRVVGSDDLVLDDAVVDQQSESLAVADHGNNTNPAPIRAPAPEAMSPAFEEIDPLVDDDEASGYQKALVHYLDQGDLHGQGEVLRRLGHLAKSRGHLQESREFYVNARNCFRKIDDNYAEAAVLLDLGQVLESLGDQDSAAAAYRDANRSLLDVAMNAGDRQDTVQAHAAD